MPQSALAELTAPAPTEENPTQQAQPPAPSPVIDDPFMSQIYTGQIPEVKKPEQEEPKQPEQQQEIPLKGKARENFERLEKAKKEQEERANRLQAEYEAAQNKLKEYEEKLAKQPTFNPEEFTKKEQEYQQRVTELQQKLQAVSLEHSPEFIEKYEQPRQHLQGVLKELATNAGIDEKEFQRALNDPDRLIEIRDSLQPREQYRWDAAVFNLEQANLNRELALKNWQQTYQNIQRDQEETWKTQRQRQLEQNLSIAKQVAEQSIETAVFAKEDPEIQAAVRNALTGLAGGEGAEQWTAEAIMKHVAAAKLQTPIIQKQHELIQNQTAEIEELKKKLSEHEEFIKKQYGSLPSTTPSNGEDKPAGKPRAIWEEVAQEVSGTGYGQFI